MRFLKHFTAAVLSACLLAGAAHAQSQDPSENIDTGAILSLSAQGAGTVTGPDMINALGVGLKCMVSISAISGTTPTLTVTLRWKDSASGNYATLLASSALSATGNTVLTVYPGIAASANVAADDVLPRTWDVQALVGGTSPLVTATVGCSVIH